MDVICSCIRRGLTNAVAALGTSLTAEQARLIARYADAGGARLYDSDVAGQKGAPSAPSDFCGILGCMYRSSRCLMARSPDEYIKQHGP